MTDATANAAPNHASISAIRIAEILGLPEPTPQQIAVIEAGSTPALVVAGAGSGKTETMANRVLWLLANGMVRPSEILGLTFTRKAAGELAERIRLRIEQLAERDLIPGGYDPFEAPMVSTYNSFANTIYRDNAMLIGRESDGTVLGEASAWQLARSIVIASNDERLPDLGKSVDTITKAVLALSAALSENIVDVASVREFTGRFVGIADLPPGGTGKYEDVVGLANSIGGLDVLLDLAEAFAAAKARRGFVQYSDQVALALSIVRSTPRIRDDYRDRYKVVLLDEYQDTSVVQTWLLAELFGGGSVMAVGDPNQSIYGWRGASAANLEGFSTQFAEDVGVPQGAQHFNLATSWRNGHDILSVANALVEPLLPQARVRVERLQPAPRATSRTVDVAYEQDIEAEAEAAALWLKARLAEPSSKGEQATAAMLFRARKSQPFFLEALRRNDVPFHVLGVGGLLAEPEITDLVSALTVLGSASAGNELVRLLAGSRWRIGVRDLRALRSVSSWLARRDYAQRQLPAEVLDVLRNSVAEGEGGSIVDALDWVATAKPEHTELAQFSELGLARLREAGAMFARLRARAGLDLLDYVTVVQQELMLDIEVAANPHRPLGSATMEAFFDALGSYLAVDESATLGGFLGWLREAEWRDGLAPRPEKPEPGRVQILTIHGSKGLEWDAVAVPRMVKDELPSKPVEGSNGWLSLGELPWPFRGDARELPEFGWEAAETRKQVVDAKAEFAAAVLNRHVLEERRLAYVAVTRARHSLLMSGSYWSTQKDPRPPSIFLRELESDRVIGELPELEDDVNPLAAEVETFAWPRDPLGHRRPAVEAAASAVREADPGATGRWERELDVLLAERAERLNPDYRVPLPDRVPASRFKEFVTDPAAVASALRRPMPEKPYRATRLGTLFHSWVEERAGVSGSSEELDVLSTELDGDLEPQDAESLGKLQAIFETSQWADLKPVEVEREIHLILDGQVIICKLDAVYSLPPTDDGTPRYQVVDWKTGKAPRDEKDLEEKQFQLALYRLAYAQWKNIDPALIDAVFYYVADNKIIAPTHLFSEAELIERWRQAI